MSDLNNVWNVAVAVIMHTDEGTSENTAHVRYSRFVQSRTDLRDQLNTGGNAANEDAAYRAALESFDHALEAAYGPLVARAVKAQSETY